ncbi:hypothetical protein FALCPG4_018726 [Fusarium falciforme]
MKPIPPFNDLPLRKDGPPGNAWGLFGDDDDLGRLNLLTPDVVKAAAAEIQEGIRVSLDWDLNQPAAPLFKRPRFQHDIINKSPRAENDDSLFFNTQSSTQWDGFRHFGYQREQIFYNGSTQDDFAKSDVLGVNAWVKKGGIVGRGILLDWAEWAGRNGIYRDPCQSGSIELGHLQVIIQEQSIEIRPADILFIRGGFIAAYERLSKADKEAFPRREPGGFLGLEVTQDSLRWLWESQFAAIASDCPTVERSPIEGPYNHPDVNLHQWCIAGWGMPLGEMFYLESLARECRRLGRWTFFVSSMPLKVPGGVASPPNAVAIF